MIQDQPALQQYNVFQIGVIQSTLNNLKDCPLQESEGAPEAYIKVQASFAEGIQDIRIGDKLVILTWLHLADRSTLKCYKRNRVGTQEFGVFSTRSPDRPNPLGLHTVEVVELVDERTIRIFPLEVLDGTPVIDIKPLI